MLLRSGYGNVHDVGYGWSYDDLLAISTAVNAPARKREQAWDDVEERARKWRRSTVEPC